MHRLLTRSGTNQRYSLQQVTLLAPTVPSKVIAISGNYWPSAETSDVPQFYFKPPSAVVGTGAAIEIPPQAKQLSFEAELAVVMGRRARWITVIDAPRYILGYTCALDVTATDLLHRDGNVTRAKAFDTFLPLGPTICPIVDPADLVLICAVNGGGASNGLNARFVFCRTAARGLFVEHSYAGTR
jgi:2-keto-4-pentenoate hydratase/2-oxohepta-3-ene-1,7-dioic acid hydratase in catechol pathway